MCDTTIISNIVFGEETKKKLWVSSLRSRTTHVGPFCNRSSSHKPFTVYMHGIRLHREHLVFREDNYIRCIWHRPEPWSVFGP